MILFTVTFAQAVTVTGHAEIRVLPGLVGYDVLLGGLAPAGSAERRLRERHGPDDAGVQLHRSWKATLTTTGIWIGNQNDTIKLETGDTIQGTVGGLTAVLTHAEEGPQTDHKVNGATAVPGVVTVSESALTVTEEDTTGGTYTVVLNTQPTANVTVHGCRALGHGRDPDPCEPDFHDGKLEHGADGDGDGR